MKFEEILFGLIFLAGMICLYDWCFLKKRRQAFVNSNETEKKLPVVVDYAYSFLPILVLVFLLRGFLFEPFRIPSGSMKPSLLEGDVILVNKYIYGLRWPLWHKRIYGKGQLKHGDVIVFKYSASKDLIKRVVGLPGDHILYKDKRLYINGKLVDFDFYSASYENNNEFGITFEMKHYKENLFGQLHDVYIRSTEEEMRYRYNDITVPENSYFVMGDNRDFSEDSRFWGFVPDKAILGKAVKVLMSYDGSNNAFRTDRFFKTIY